MPGILGGGRLLFDVVLGPQRFRLLAWPALASQHEIDDSAREHQERGPHVDTNAENMGRVIDPHQLDPAPADRVPGDVQRERAAMAEPELLVRPDHEYRDTEVPQQLVEEGG